MPKPVNAAAPLELSTFPAMRFMDGLPKKSATK